MSADLRLKKLRGSGGYIMASVDDEQQRKGNLGGPDLFLAPIGRLDSTKITKHFCNTCDKEYEGGPRIDFDNPNEEVAENLMLVEKGQYICTSCGSTIAEYREFKKPDQIAEVGIAKPITQEPPIEPTYSEPIQETPSINDIPVPEFEPEPIQETPKDIPSPKFEPVADTPSQELGSINSIVGLQVYNEDAKKIGTVKQVGISSSQTLALVVTKDDGNEETIPWDKIKTVGEIVLLGKNTSQVQVNNCTNCNFVNKDGSKFCEECGSKL